MERERPSADSSGLLEKAILALAKVDDGATSRDGTGFNKLDAPFFRPYVETVTAGRTIPSPMRPRVTKRLQKYVTQLFQLGINVNDVMAEEQGPEGSSRRGTARDAGRPKALADALLEEGQNYFARDAGGKLYRYNAGVYVPGAEEFVRRQVQLLLEERNLSSLWSSHLANETVEYIRVGSRELWSRPPDNVINVKNGLLDVVTREMSPHSPDFLSPIQLPVAYDPRAECPAIDQFIWEVFPEDSIDQAYEIVGVSMVPGEAQDKAVLLLVS